MRIAHGLCHHYPYLPNNSIPFTASSEPNYNAITWLLIFTCFVVLFDPYSKFCSVVFTRSAAASALAPTSLIEFRPRLKKNTCMYM